MRKERHVYKRHYLVFITNGNFQLNSNTFTSQLRMPCTIRDVRSLTPPPFITDEISFKYPMTFLMFRIFFFRRGGSQILFPSFHKSYRSSNAQDWLRKWPFISPSLPCRSRLPSLSFPHLLSVSDSASANLYAPAYAIFIRTALGEKGGEEGHERSILTRYLWRCA